MHDVCSANSVGIYNCLQLTDALSCSLCIVHIQPMHLGCKVKQQAAVNCEGFAAVYLASQRSSSLRQQVKALKPLRVVHTAWVHILLAIMQFSYWLR